MGPGDAASELGQKLTARGRHVCLFLGAGASRSAGLPDIAGLKKAVLAALKGDDRKRAEALLEDRNIEEGLSLLRRLRALAADLDDEVAGWRADDASALDDKICQAIIAAVSLDKADVTAFEALAAWVARTAYQQPLEIFTTNWDLLIESGLEARGVPYFDGFVGNVAGRFRADMVDSATQSVTVPASFARLWKIHGSVNWARQEIDAHVHLVRTGAPVDPATSAAIYPSEEKYADSRRVPFVVLVDRLRRALAMPETIMLVSGFSFGDAHLNEILFESIRHHPRSELVALCHGAAPDHLVEEAARSRNLTVFGATNGVLGGSGFAWDHPPDAIEHVWDKQFLLGDFSHFAAFLAAQSSVDS